MTLILSGTDGLSDVDGSAATPAVRGTDANTGIFFPAADTIAFAEGGVESARFDSSGNLGLGTTSPAAKLDVAGSQAQNIVAVAALDINCSTGNYFTKTINGASTFTFSNAPASRAYSFTLELTVTSGAATWPASVKWPADTAPTLGTGKTSLLVFVTDDGGTRWRGGSLVDYTT